jgi:hypothetical protein
VESRRRSVFRFGVIPAELSDRLVGPQLMWGGP